MLLTISVVNKHMVSHKRSITAESESNTSFLNPIERICFQICSIGFISGVYGGMERSCIFSGQRNAFDLCHAAPSHTNRIISSGYCAESFSRNILVHSVSQVGIEEKQAFFREEYRDYGLLICQTDGRPVDPRNLEKSFKEHQKRIGIPENERIDFQGLRKSGQMHKVRLSQNNYQLVAENAGQSPEVLMNHYNEALDYEKRALSRLVENSFYPHRETSGEAQDSADVSALMAQIQQNPELCRKLLQSLTLGTQQRV